MITGIRNAQQRQNFGISEEFVQKRSAQAIKQGQTAVEKIAKSEQVSTLQDAFWQANSAGDLLCLLTLGTHK